MYSPYCLTQVKVFSYSAWQGCRPNFARVVIIAVRLSTSLHRLFVFFLLSDSQSVTLLCVKPPILGAQFVPLIFARRTWCCFFLFWFFLERKWRFSLNVFRAKKKRKKRRRGALQEEGNGGRGTHACYGVDGKFNVTAAVADLSEGSRLTVCWPMRGVERCAHCRL